MAIAMIWPENRNSQAEPKTWAVVASYIKTKGEDPGENLGPWLLPAQVVRQIRSGCARGMTPIGHSFCRATVSHPECLREGGQQARPGKTDKHQPVMTSKQHFSGRSVKCKSPAALWHCHCHRSSQGSCRPRGTRPPRVWRLSGLRKHGWPEVRRARCFARSCCLVSGTCAGTGAPSCEAGFLRIPSRSDSAGPLDWTRFQFGP